MKAQQPQFGVGQHIIFGSGALEETFEVTRYHKVNGRYEVMLRNLATGKHRSVPLKQLEAALATATIMAGAGS